MSESVITALLIILFSLAAVNVAVNPTPSADTGNTTVVEVVDGDTVDIRKDGQQDTVRVLGIDTPEIYSANTPSEFFLENNSENRQCLENIGEKATELVKQKIAGQEVEIVEDSLSDKRGSYGRLLGYIEHNQTDIGKVLLKKGYARVYNSTFERKEEYRELETESREEREGIWNESCGEIS
jgi:micrococcal nuclease